MEVACELDVVVCPLVRPRRLAEFVLEAKYVSN
jgi:hypothetical protein